jgi:hypothetical protein
VTSQAGLFSAVVSAFFLQSYQSLQENYNQTSADLLRQISQQLANSSFPAAPNSSQFQAQPLDVQINRVWSVSLVLSLVAALFGIFLKQWMRAYMKWTDVTPEREAVSLRQFRYHSLKKWRISTILASLPTLLQVSVMLFLSGFVWFLDVNNSTYDVMHWLLMIATYLLYVANVWSAFVWTCPYRSPLSRGIWIVWCIGGGGILAFVAAIWNFGHFKRTLVDCWHQILTEIRKSWVQRDQAAIAGRNRRKDRVSTHVGAIVRMCRTTQSQSLWSTAITAIVEECSPDSPIRSSGNGDAYLKKIWWPMLGHIVSLHEEDLPAVRSNWPHTLVQQMSERVERFSLFF